MREIRLRDGSSWRLETEQEAPPTGAGRQDRERRRALARRTYVWVRCVGPDGAFRLMFAAAWEFWPEDALARVVEAERGRLAAAARRRAPNEAARPRAATE